MKLLIAINYPLFDLWTAPAWLPDRLRADFPNLEVVMLPNYDRVSDEITDADIYFGWFLKGEQFRQAKKLRWIHSTAAGVHQLISPELIRSDAVVTNARDVHGAVVAEHALALILALAKRLPSAMRAQQQHRWAQQDMWNETPRPREVAAATLGLIGFGGIGQQLAARAAALDMKIIAVREHPEKGSGSDADLEVVGPDALDSILPRCDYVVICAPLTPRTRNLFDAARLAHMRPESYLINVSRGPLIDEDALIAALRDRRIAGAALDVFSHEPLAADSPLWDLPNVFITPHTAAATDKLWERHYTLILENMRRFLAGKPLLYVVDKSRGY